jgi:formylglycine-generating enzyme required for sulfatase activity
MQNYLKVAVSIAALFGMPHAVSAAQLGKAGTEFQDCPECPVMVVLPQQSFWMGSPDTETGRSANEGPLRRITINYGIAMGKYEVTFAEWDACIADGGCDGKHAKDEGRGRGDLPVINVDWNDAQAYAQWLSKKTGHTYRLPSEAEWEYASKAGSSTTYSWGDTASHAHANYGMDTCCGGFVIGPDEWEVSAPVGRFLPNPFGLHDLSGNLWEWVEDCWDPNPATGPVDGGPRRDGDCGLRIMKGGSWASMPVRIRASFRDAYTPGDYGEFIGFRVARSN